MALLNIQFDQTEIAQAQKGGDFAPIPAGTYIAQINRSEIKSTKAGTGSYLSLGFQIVEGEYEGRMIFQNITLANPNQVAAQIGREQLAQLAGACGIYQLGDSQELHGIPMQIRVGIEVDKTGQYEPSNNIKKFMALQGQAPSVQAPVQQQPQQGFAPQQAPVTQGAKRQPWERGATA